MDALDHQLLRAAVAAATRGWYVFPIRPGLKRPPALHGHKRCAATGICRNGHQGWEQRAMNDPDRIRWYWTSERYRGSNIGIAAGPSGIVLVDLDMPKSADDIPPDHLRAQGIHDGLDHFALICADHGQPFPSDTLTGRTARSGWHLFFRAPENVRLPSTEGDKGHGLGWKIDTRAWGGYIVAPGSITPDGVYRIVDDRPETPLAAWLTARLTPKPVVHTTAPPPRSSARLGAYTAAAVRGECDRVAAAPGGQHKKTLFSASGNLGQHVGGGGLSYGDAEAELYDAARQMLATADANCDCSDYEIRRTITNGLRAGMQRPRVPNTKTPA
jgi:hypothetical protein